MSDLREQEQEYYWQMKLIIKRQKLTKPIIQMQI